MRWIPTGILTALALVITFKCFFSYGNEWLFIPAGILFLLAVGVNLNMPSDEPVHTPADPSHH
jgi:hypothetical protein